MECRVVWTEHMTFLAETGSGHMVTMDGPPDAGGRNLAPRPMEMMLAGAGGCTAFDVVMILKRGRHPVTGCEVVLKAERADTDPKVFTKLHLHFVVTGNGLKPEAVERAVAAGGCDQREADRRALRAPHGQRDLRQSAEARDGGHAGPTTFHPFHRTLSFLPRRDLFRR